MCVVRLERRQLIARRGEMGRNLNQPHRHFFIRQVLLAQDFEEFILETAVGWFGFDENRALSLA